MSEEEYPLPDNIDSRRIILLDGLEHIRSKVNDLMRMSKILVNEGEEINGEIEEIKSLLVETSQGPQGFSNEVKKIKRRIGEFDDDFNKWKRKKKRLRRRYQEIINHFDDYSISYELMNEERESYEEKFNEIDELFNHAEERENELDLLQSNFQDFIKVTKTDRPEIEVELEDVREERTKLTNTREQVENLLERVKDREKELNEKFERRIEETETLISSLEEREQAITVVENEVKELEETASNLVQGQAGASIGRQFANRKEELENSVRIWGAASIISIIFLVASAIIMYQDVVRGGIEGMTAFSSITLVIPISVAVWFTSSNYRQQKRLMNEYEFKSNMALSLMGFREVLKEDIPEGEEVKVGEFIIDTMDKIYSNPQDNVQNQDPNQNDDPLTMGQKPLAEIINRLSK